MTPSCRTDAVAPVNGLSAASAGSEPAQNASTNPAAKRPRVHETDIDFIQILSFAVLSHRPLATLRVPIQAAGSPPGGARRPDFSNRPVGAPGPRLQQHRARRVIHLRCDVQCRGSAAEVPCVCSVFARISHGFEASPRAAARASQRAAPESDSAVALTLPESLPSHPCLPPRLGSQVAAD